MGPNGPVYQGSPMPEFGSKLFSDFYPECFRALPSIGCEINVGVE